MGTNSSTNNSNSYTDGYKIYTNIHTSHTNTESIFYINKIIQTYKDVSGNFITDEESFVTIMVM